MQSALPRLFELIVDNGQLKNMIDFIPNKKGIQVGFLSISFPVALHLLLFLPVVQWLHDADSYYFLHV